jgi:hypothetical protein
MSDAIYTMALIGLLLVTPFATYLVVETGKTLNCSTGWTLQDDGSYMCKTTSSTRYAYCSKVSDTLTGKKNYYCKEAILKEIEQQNNLNSGLTYVCPYNKGCYQI